MAKASLKKASPKTTKKARPPQKSVATAKRMIKASPSKAVSTPKKGPLVIQAPFKQSELLKTLAERTTLSKKEVTSVLETLKEIMVAHLQKKGPQQFKWPGLLLMKIKNKPATKARKGINPFTGEETTFAAKPASRAVKISALKGLKEAI